MKRFVIISAMMLFLSPILSSLEMYQIAEKQAEPYALVIRESDKFASEYIVGLLELGPLDQEWWIISERSRLNDDGSFVFRNGLSGYEIILNRQDAVAVVIYRQYDLRFEMHQVDEIQYKGWEIGLPEIFLE